MVWGAWSQRSRAGDELEPDSALRGLGSWKSPLGGRARHKAGGMDWVLAVLAVPAQERSLRASGVKEESPSGRVFLLYGMHT